MRYLQKKIYLVNGQPYWGEEIINSEGKINETKKKIKKI